MKDCTPKLGCATTRELLTEIQARGEVSATIGEYPQEMGDMAIGAANLLATLPGSMLDYRTVGTFVTEDRVILSQAASIIERWRQIANFGGTDYSVEEVAAAAAPLAAESDAWLAVHRQDNDDG